MIVGIPHSNSKCTKFAQHTKKQQETLKLFMCRSIRILICTHVLIICRICFWFTSFFFVFFKYLEHSIPISEAKLKSFATAVWLGKGPKAAAQLGYWV